MQETDETRKRRATKHVRPVGVPMNAPQDTLLLIFAQNLQRAMQKKGWSQSDLAREATKHLNGDEVVNRDTISKYVNMKSSPGHLRLKALADALGVETTDLYPPAGMATTTDRTVPVGVSDMGDGNTWLRVNQPVPWPVALKVLELLKG